MESFTTKINGFTPLTIVAKFSILNVCGSPAYASEELRHKFTIQTIYNQLDDVKISLEQLPQVLSKTAFEKCRNTPRKTSKMKSFLVITNPFLIIFTNFSEQLIPQNNCGKLLLYQFNRISIIIVTYQQIHVCSQSTIRTEKGVKYVQS